MKKIIPVLIALLLILIIGAVTLGSILVEKYSYSDERADLDEYFGASKGRLAIVLQDQIVEEKARIFNGACYFDLDTTERYFNDGFYVDQTEKLVLYTTATEIYSVAIGDTVLQCRNSVSGEPVTEALSYVPVMEEEGTIYLAAQYLQKFTNFSLEIFERQVQVYTEWGTREVDTIKKDTAVRVRGGIKSPILCDVTAGEEIEILEMMETWCKVKTKESIIGYVENKFLTKRSEGTGDAVQEIPVTDYVEPEYTTQMLDGKVCLGWHSIGGVAGNSTLENMVAAAQGMNVIAPTWFSLNDEAGSFRSFASKDYVDRAHDMGLKVWGVWDDFNHSKETGTALSVHTILSQTSIRQRLVENIVNTALQLELDGINIDFEKISEVTGTHYVQFLRELSVECRKSSLTLSIDNYVPYDYRDYYRLDIQGKVADYVIIMGYDEHWHGSKDPGSVASLGYVSNGIVKALEDVPAGKLVNALPFYTILWQTTGVEVTDDYITLNNTADFLSRMNLTPEWSEEDGQNYAEWKSGETLYQIWLEDEQSIAAKLNVMAANKLAGVAVWRLGYGTESVWNLIRSYVNN